MVYVALLAAELRFPRSLPPPFVAAASCADVDRRVSRRDVKAVANKSCTEFPSEDEDDEPRGDVEPFTCLIRAAARPGMVEWCGTKEAAADDDEEEEAEEEEEEEEEEEDDRGFARDDFRPTDVDSVQRAQ